MFKPDAPRHPRRRGRTTTTRRLLTLLAIALALVSLAPAAAFAQVPPLTYEIHVVSGSVDRRPTGTLGVPMAISLDAFPDPEVIVQLVGFPEPNVVAQLSVTTLKSLPLGVEIIYTIDGVRIHAGYDARGTGIVAPARWDANLVATPDFSSLDLTMSSVLPGRVLTVFGRTQKVTSGSQEIIDVRSTLDPVPALLRLFGRKNSDRAIIDIRPNVAAKIAARLFGVTRGIVYQADALIDRAPEMSALEVVRRPEPAGAKVVFTSSAPISSIEATGVVDTPETIVNGHIVPAKTTRFLGRLKGISARRIEVDNDADDHVVVRYPMGGVVSEAELGLAENGPIDLRPAPSEPSADFVRIIDRGSYLSVAGRLRNVGPVQSLPAGARPVPSGFPVAEVGWGAPLTVKVQHLEARPVHVLADTESETVAAVVRNVPAWAHVEYQSGRKVFFDGSEPISELRADVQARTGRTLFSRVAALSIVLRGVPTGLTLTTEIVRDGLGTKATFDAADKSIEVVDVRMMSGATSTQLPAGDGLLFVDSASLFLIQSRVTGLTRVAYDNRGLCLSARCGSQITVGLTSRRGIPFRIDARPNGSDQTIATLGNRPSTIHFQLLTRKNDDGETTRTVFDWLADAPSGPLTLTSPAVQRSLTISPVPSRVRFCLEQKSNFCSQHGRRANKISLSLETGSVFAPPSPADRTTINFQQCTKAPCFRRDGEWIRIQNLHVQRFRAAVDEGADTEIFVDTERTFLNGSVEVEDGKASTYEDYKFVLPSGFWAKNRLVIVDPPIVSAIGEITCPSGTEAIVWIPNPVFEAAGLTGVNMLELAFGENNIKTNIAPLICKGDLPLIPFL